VSNYLHFAIRERKLEFVELLLKYGAEPALRAETGLTALEYAKKLKNSKAVEILDRYAQYVFKNGDDPIPPPNVQ